MISVGILGGTGYTGKKLVEYCNNHPLIKDINIYGKESAGKSILTVFPELYNEVADTKIKDIFQLSLNHDVYFIALPHGDSLNYVPMIYKAGKLAIDLGGDYRLNNAALYKQWYNYNHTSPDLLNEKVYGLADYSQTNYSGKKIIANPGCYPTAVLLALLPLISYFNEKIYSISVSAYSGTSGAGKSQKTELMMSEMFGNVSAYKLNTHQHQPEILEQLQRNGFNAPFSFATHLLPISTGIYATSFIHLKNEIDKESISKKYKEFYSESSFVRILETPPNLKNVVNTNYCDINISAKDKIVIITSAIDNLVKGAAGQAVQNLNKVYGWKETLGIRNRRSTGCLNI